MKVTAFHHAPRWALAALLLAACVDVKQDPPFTADQFTVADFSTSTGKVPFPIFLPCAQTDPATGACLSGGTFACAAADCSTGGKVALPITPCRTDTTPPQVPCVSAGNPVGCVACDSATGAQLKAGLNTLDGFSNYGELRTTFNKPLKDDSVTKAVAFLIDTTTGRPADFSPRAITVDGVASILFQPEIPESGTVTAAVRPLKPETTYLAVITRGVLDVAGRPIEPDTTFAFIRARDALANVDGSPIPGSLLGGASAKTFGCTQTTEAGQQACITATRSTLERLRRSYDVIFKSLEGAPSPLPRESIALLWTVRTQSTAKAMLGLRQVLAAIPTTFTQPAAAQVPGTAVYVPQGLDAAAVKVDHFQLGCMQNAMFLTPTSGAFSASAQGLPNFRPQAIPYVLAVPSGTAPSTGWPLAIFGHGLGRWRYDMIAIANTLAIFGIATVSIDHVWHGARTNLVLGSEQSSVLGCTAAVTGPAASPPVMCSDPTGVYNAAATPPSCSVGTPLASGQRMFNPANLFATRDNFRQAVIDQMQLVRVMKAAQTAGGTPAFDTSKLFYVGQSLGGLIGGIFMAVEPDVKVGVLNVPGGGLANLIEDTQTKEICKPVFDGLAQLGICERADAVTAPCTCKSTGAYLQFIHTAQWILDSGDPINFGWHLVDKPLYCQPAVQGSPAVPCAAAPGATPIKKHILVQRMANDQVVPNITTNALIGAIGPSACYRAFTGGVHGFLLTPTDPNVQVGQVQVVSFLASGGATTKLPQLGGTAADACPIIP